MAILDSEPSANIEHLTEALRIAMADDAPPPMLKNLLRTAAAELIAWQHRRSERGLRVAECALAEWRRWRASR